MRLIFLFCFFWTTFLSADEFDFFPEKGDITLIPSGQVFHGRYVETGDTIEVDGIIDGDAYLVGTQIIIDGEIRGNLYAAGAVVVVNGKITGNSKILAGQVSIEGEIFGDSAIFGVNINFPSKGCLLGNLFLLAGYCDIENTIEGNVLALAGGLKLSGTMKKDLQTFVGRLRLMGTAEIDGNLTYRSSYSLTRDPGAKVLGEIVYKTSFFRDVVDMPILSGVVIGSRVASFLMNFLYTFGVGAILIRFFPKKIESALRVLRKTPWKSFFVGVLILILLPISSFFLLITVIGTPFALTLMALNIISFYTVKIFSILWLSNALFESIGWKKNKVLTLFLGQLLYYSLCYIPFVGWFISLFAMLFGLGSSILGQFKKDS